MGVGEDVCTCVCKCEYHTSQYLNKFKRITCIPVPNLQLNRCHDVEED